MHAMVKVLPFVYNVHQSFSVLVHHLQSPEDILKPWNEPPRGSTWSRNFTRHVAEKFCVRV